MKKNKVKKIPIARTVLNQLYYKQRLSMQDITNRLGVTFPTVWYWMKKHNLPRRCRSESIYCKLNPDGDPFNIKDKLNRKEKDLLLTGLMLYWAEGNKATRGSIQLANLNHKMLQSFVKFLREICRVREEKIKLYVRVYKKFSKKEAKKYWAKQLKMLPKRISVYCHKDERSKISKQWSRYGIATVQLYNLKLHDWINSAIDEHVEKLLEK